MPRLSESTLVEATYSIVKPIARRNELHTITHKLVRKKVEEKLGLEEGTANDAEYRQIIRKATEEAMEEAPDGEGAHEEEGPAERAHGRTSSPSASSSKRKRNPSPAAEATPSPPRKTSRSRKSAKRAAPEDEEEAEEGSEPDYQEEGSEEETSRKAKKSRAKPAAKSKPAPKRRKSSSKAISDGVQDEDMEADEKPAPRKRVSKAKPSKSKDDAQYKTPEHVPTSDIEQDEPGDAPPSKAHSPAKPRSKPPSPRKAAPAKKKSAAVVVSDAEDDETETEKPSKKEKRPPSPKKGEAAKPTENGDDSDTGLSDLIDEPPKKKRQPKAKDGKAATSKAKESSGKRRSSTSKPGLSKDEEQIKKLKSLVLACGVRKVWSKLFKDMDSRQQIAKLKEMLADLGMTGRLSLEKAKEIKAKREFEQELQDVKEFAQSIEQRESRRARKAQEPESEEEKADESEEEEEVAPKRRASNARNSIAAFLQDQSDSE